MGLVFLDTNVIVRYITQDDSEQAQRAHDFFEQVEAGAQSITACEGVIVESVQVLSSKRLYNHPRSEVRGYLTALLRLPGFHLPGKRIYLQALDLYASTNLDFVDALAAAHLKRTKLTTIVSFDRDFDRIPGITRREP